MGECRWAATAAAVLLAVLALGSSPGGAAAAVDHGASYLTLVDPAGRAVTYTALGLQVGDAYIDEDNTLYEVTGVAGGQARVMPRGRVQLPDLKLPPSPELAGAAGPALAQGRRGRVAIYHTHNDESYVPTSGIANREGRGDIHEVGRALAEELRRQGYAVDWSQALHLPHDGQAYFRSRRTLMRLLRRRPQTALDVHRDAVPRAEEYRATVAGMQVSRVRLVVGRQNPNRNANLDYAKRIKAVADRWYPGLVKGIFLASSDYNQDLGPRVLLLEFGTHTTSLEEARRAARLMAQVIPAAAGMAPGTAGPAQGAASRAGGRTLAWLLILLAGGGVAFVLVNREGWTRLKRSWGRLVGLEGTGEGDDTPR